MSKPVTVVDDIVFGLDPSYKLPLHNQHSWIGQIDAPAAAFDEYVAMTYASIQLKNVIIDVFTGDVPRGDKMNKLLVQYDDRLTAALTELRPSNPADKGMFDSYLKLSLEEALVGTRHKLPTNTDMCFLINMYGNAWRYFGEAMQKPSMLERFLDVVTGKKGMTIEHTLMAAAATATDYATALKDGVIELTSDHRDNLVATASIIAKVGQNAGVKDSLTALNHAIEELEKAPTLEPSALAM
jgi:hypothetical protein